ncbi:hypothetical protein [Pseudooceanicola batsensis]|nr:hypothetical protein [Pseudooceanicola batsensis]
MASTSDTTGHAGRTKDVTPRRRPAHAGGGRALTFALAAIASIAGAQAQADRMTMPGSLPLDAQVSSGTVRLIWPDASPKRVGNVEVSRRILNDYLKDPWRVIAPQIGPVVAFRDDEAAPGVAWEYRVRRFAKQLHDQGHYVAGTKIPATETRGTAILVIDESIADDLRPELDRFHDDLTGDGWHVRRLQTPSGRGIEKTEELARARKLKDRIRALHEAGGRGDVSIILVGHVPLVMSGSTAPDGHKIRAFGSDLFYADIDGTWPAKPDGTLVPSRIPDGRIEASVGRIDFTNFTREAPEKEIGYLRAYFDRNHAWRHGEGPALRNAYYGSVGHLGVEKNGLANIVGPEAMVEGGHQTTGQERRWLWGVDFGNYKGWDYIAEGHRARPVFAINFGSNKLSIERPGNAMTAMLTDPSEALAVAWGGRPAWQIHAMALGRTIGDAQLRTVNNGPPAGEGFFETEYLPTGQYPFIHPIWGNLLGDPTLHAFPVKPPGELMAKRSDDRVTLTWSTGDREDGTYWVYRETPDGVFEKIGATAPGETRYSVAAPENATTRYMVRRHVLNTVHAGSFHALSQGIFATCCDS